MNSASQLEHAFAAIEQDFRLYKKINEIEARFRQTQAELRIYFQRFYPHVDEHFAIPADYLQLIYLAGGTRVCPHETFEDWSFRLYGLPHQGDCDLWAYLHKTEMSIWLEIGHYGERHHILLCCDRRDPKFGTVVECNDEHPWATIARNGNFWGEWTNTIAFLQWLREEWLGDDNDQVDEP